MFFVGFIGTLVADLLKSVFGGVEKMLPDKIFSQNTKAPRICVEELLRSIVQNESVSKFESIMVLLNSSAKKSRTAHLWLKALIWPVILIMRFVRACRETDWPLLNHTLKLMLPYFAAAGHWHHPPLRFCIPNENDETTQKSTQKMFRWGTCYAASKQHMVRYDFRNHCHAIRALSKWNDGTNIQ